jgi:GTPase SAR1 family protein
VGQNQVKSKIKVVFLGDQSTGKTSILLRFMHDRFDEGQAVHGGLTRRRSASISWPKTSRSTAPTSVCSYGTRRDSRGSGR